jgi:hypothetical protein
MYKFSQSSVLSACFPSVVFFLTLGASPIAHASSILLVTDEPSMAKAKDVTDLFHTSEPFSKLKDLQVSTVYVSSQTLGCDEGPSPQFTAAFNTLDDDQKLIYAESMRRHGAISKLAKPMASCSLVQLQAQVPSNRLVSCDTPQAKKVLGALFKKYQPNFLIIVKLNPNYGGSGGDYPLLTTGSPSNMAFHELMHRLGFADEYEYPDACEADTYCHIQHDDWISLSGFGALPGTAFNVARFNALSSYASDKSARIKHHRKIPWYAQIDAQTPIEVGGKLGSLPSDATALYKTNVCAKGNFRHDTWTPTTAVTIMQTLHTSYIPPIYWPIIAKSLGTEIIN